jgi:L-threonylcarbamoyladenylate synthase
MRTKITNDIGEALLWLRQGIEPIAIPTETVYGLAARIDAPEALKKIFHVKRRPQDNPLIVHVACKEQAFEWIDSSSPWFLKLGAHFWPGPLTLVAPSIRPLSSFVTAGLSTVAVRVPRHPITRRLLEELKVPLAAPSANLSGRPSPTSALAVLEDLQGTIPLILDGGPSEEGLESTVLYLDGDRIYLLRSGAIPRQSIELVLGRPLERATNHTHSKASPGTRYRHYAPRAQVELFDQAELAKRYPFILSREPLDHPSWHPLASSTLYEMLRLADRCQVSLIGVYCDFLTRQNEALMERLIKASCAE